MSQSETSFVQNKEECSVSTAEFIAGLVNEIVCNSFGESKKEQKTSPLSSDFSLVCLHIETFEVSNAGELEVTQLGCSTALNLASQQRVQLFSPAAPANLNHFLNNYKLEGDLLKALHMQESQEGKFEFRAQFEIKRKEKNKVFCLTEQEALESFANYLENLENVVLMAIEERTLEIVMKKLAQLKRTKKLPVVGFTTWPKLLKHSKDYLDSDNSFTADTDVEDFYSDHIQKITGYISALDVSNFMRMSVKLLCTKFSKRFKEIFPEKGFKRKYFLNKVVQSIDSLEKPSDILIKTTEPLSVSVFSSFRPAVSTKIGLEPLETIELSSGEEDSEYESEVELPDSEEEPEFITDKVRTNTTPSVRPIVQGRNISLTKVGQNNRSKPSRDESDGSEVQLDDSEEEIDEILDSAKTRSFHAAQSFARRGISVTRAGENNKRKSPFQIRNVSRRKRLIVDDPIMISSGESEDESDCISVENVPVSPNQIQPNQCIICAKTFIDCFDLGFHVKTKHMQCEDCGLQFQQTGDTQKHRRIFHPQKPNAIFIE